MVIFEQMLVMLFLLIAGVIAAKAGVMDEETNRRFTRFNLLIPQTCMILSSILGADIDVSVGRVFGILGAALIVYAVILWRRSRNPKEEKEALKPDDQSLK